MHRLSYHCTLDARNVAELLTLDGHKAHADGLYVYTDAPASESERIAAELSPHGLMFPTTTNGAR